MALWPLLPSDANVVFSPASADIALQALAWGARGPTRRVLADVLGLRSGDDVVELATSTRAQLAAWRDHEPVTTAEVRNRLFLDRHIALAPEYRQACARWLGRESVPVASSEDADGLRQAIQGWLSEALEAPTVLSLPVDEHTAAVQVSTLRFASPWSSFHEEDTRHRPFHLTGGTTIQTPTMHGEVQTVHRVRPHAEALTLELGENGAKITFIVPRGRHTLAEVEADLDRTLDTWLNPGEGADSVRWILAIPKVTFRSPPLDLCRLFASDEHGPCTQAADLSGVGRPRDPTRSLYVDSAIQTTELTIDERGVRATALTVTMMSVTVGARPEPFALDRPFLFVVHDPASGAVLFMGRVVDPREA